MKRYASIDFLRGIAIFLMIILHTVNSTLDIDGLLSQINSVEMINLIMFITLPFMGGLAGLFLLVSAIVNMVSMQNQLQKGVSPPSLALRQIIGGGLIVFFGALTEAAIGYHAAFGEIFKHLNLINVMFQNLDMQTWWHVILWRGYHIETIHAIGYCVIGNGVVQALLSIKGHWKNSKKIMRVYAILIGIVLILTPFVWQLSELIYPGYPYAPNPETGNWIMYPYIGITPFKDFVILFFLNPIAGHVEPIFPYLAVSFMGSIIGLYLTQEKSQINPKFPHQMIRLGFIMFVIGMIGLLVNYVLIMETSMDEALYLYTELWDHRKYTQAAGFRYAGWLFQFSLVNGFSLAATMFFIRLIEFRGKGANFAQKTTFFRRFGFVAFTVYNSQWLYFGSYYLVNVLFNDTPYKKYLWDKVIVVELVCLVIFWIILVLWEKIDYIGSIEWWIGTCQYLLQPIRRKSFIDNWKKNRKPNILDYGRLDVDNTFYNAEWVNINEAKDMDPVLLNESKYSRNLAFIGLIFFPISFIGLAIALKARKIEQTNKYNRQAIIIALIGIAATILWTVLLSLLSLADLGISL